MKNENHQQNPLYSISIELTYTEAEKNGTKSFSPFSLPTKCPHSRTHRQTNRTKTVDSEIRIRETATKKKLSACSFTLTATLKRSSQWVKKQQRTDYFVIIVHASRFVHEQT